MIMKDSSLAQCEQSIPTQTKIDQLPQLVSNGKLDLHMRPKISTAIGTAIERLVQPALAPYRNSPDQECLASPTAEVAERLAEVACETSS